MKFLQDLFSPFTKLSKKTKILLVLFAVAVLFTRLYNLEGTARFTQDESSDLARMRGYWLTKQITLIGPISNDGSKIFSSLSYYMILPFAAAFGFTPVAPVYGMAFWGILTAGLLLLLTYSYNKKLLIPAAMLIAIWYPLVLTSRWSWNPHFVIFWAALGLLSLRYQKKLGNFAYLLTGFAFGSMFHHHYVAIFTTAPFLLLISLPLLKKKEFKPVILMFIGYIFPHLAFVLFDLKNPPGLFFGQYLRSGNTPHVEQSLTADLAWSHFVRNIDIYLDTFIKNSFLQIVFGLSLLSLMYLEFKKSFYKTLTWVFPSIAIILAGIMLNDFQIRYVFSSVAFLFVWLIMPRKESLNKFLAKFALVILLIGSVFSLKSQLTQTETPPDMRTFTKASNIIVNVIKTKKVKHYNIAALSSPDSAPLAERYRDYIYTRGVVFQAPSQYNISEHLFVVSTATNEILREDQSYAMIAFKDKALKEVFPIEGTEWKVFWYGVDIED
jgi:hypothetical protein